ncbi:MULTISPECIES: hypothetical protein [unclassified Brenneria]|uniref:hypothetical protein n=1 Tax=unclassified Brenneria TaxID=2634434 RepID=UPI0029C1CA02|nr:MULTISPECIES: hypothetical protein [unclassified Brenneria]MDX5626459.1 hypothetical protein [Brenneria sp. L3-3Z]MDX5694191.1 hypothetical protein [Brenneria sp. L4-2C]MEE3662579.1 hypothetical protein [Brenneria sp. g21c3]
MRRLKQWALFSGLTLCSLAAGATSASTGAAGGIIRFTGAIVEGPCVVSTKQAAVGLSCHHGGKQASYQYNARSAKAFSKGLPEFIDNARLQWINPERTQSVLTITYL